MVEKSENQDLTELKSAALQFAIDESKLVYLKKIEQKLALLDKNKSVFKQVSGKDFVKNQRKKFENDKEFVEAQFENMRPEMEKMMNRVNKRIARDNLRESESPDSEQEFERKEPQDMLHDGTQAYKEELEKEIITLKEIIEK